MKCVVNWIPLRIRVRSRNTQTHLECVLLRLRERADINVGQLVIIAQPQLQGCKDLPVVAILVARAIQNKHV